MCEEAPLRQRQSVPLDLPPVYRSVTLREVGDAFAHARAIAGDSGAGTLVFVGRFDLAEFALVLEPDEPLALARRSFFAGMVALAEAVSGLAPPEKPVTVSWPDALLVDGGLVGGGRLGWPDGAAADQIPDWLVFGGTIRTVAMGAEEPGLRPLSAALEDEGFEEYGAERLVAGFARHLMLVTDTWREFGFGAVAQSYVKRLAPLPGVQRTLSETGDLMLRRSGTVDAERQPLLDALAAPSWLDPATGGPRW